MTRRPFGKQGGFTLVELLVVIAIIGLLISLLLPAVNTVRESARRVSCANNLRQVSIGLLQYHDSFQVFPANFGSGVALSPTTPPNVNANNYGHSWMAGVLPYIEQQSLYDTINQEQPLSFANNTAASKQVIPLYLCPSDGLNGRGLLGSRSDLLDERAVTNYKACAGANWGVGDFSFASRSAKWPGELDGYEKGDGVICRNQNSSRSNHIGLTAILDGTSNTFLVGECLPAYSQWCWWYWFNGSTGTCGIPLNYRKKFGPAFLANQAQDWPNNSGFMSMHPGGAQFAFADGHIRFIEDSIPLSTYRKMASISDGETVTEP